MPLSKKDISKYVKDSNVYATGADQDFVPSEDDFEGIDEQDEHLFIASKFTNGTKPDSIHFRQWEIPLSKGDAIWFQDLLDDYKAKNKTTINFWSWFLGVVNKNTNQDISDE